MFTLYAFPKTNCLMLSWKTWIFAFYSFSMDYIQVTTYRRQLAKKPALLASYPAFVMSPRGIGTHVCYWLCQVPDTLSSSAHQSEVSAARGV